jgi:hypothetical protein
MVGKAVPDLMAPLSPALSTGERVIADLIHRRESGKK